MYICSAVSRSSAPVATDINVIRESTSFIYYNIRLEYKAPALSVGVV